MKIIWDIQPRIASGENPGELYHSVSVVNIF